MWAMLLGYIIPAGVSLYGLSCLAAGDVDGFASRSLRGWGGRLLALVLLAALPIAIVVAPLVPFDPFPRKRDLTGDIRDAEITRDVLVLNRDYSAWLRANRPVREGDGDPTGQYLARLNAFNAEADRRKVELNSRVAELKAEQDRLREERREREEKAKENALHRSALWIGVAVFVIVRTLTTALGRREEPKVEPPAATAEPAPPAEPPVA